MSRIQCSSNDVRFRFEAPSSQLMRMLLACNRASLTRPVGASVYVLGQIGHIALESYLQQSEESAAKRSQISLLCETRSAYLFAVKTKRRH